jgi:uncharacterized protein
MRQLRAGGDGLVSRMAAARIAPSGDDFVLTPPVVAPMIARAMTTQPNAEPIEPLTLARREAVWSGEIPLTALPRLTAEVVEAGGDEHGSIDVALKFFRDADGRARTRGHVAAVVVLTCQRCLEPVAHQLDVAIELWLVQNEAQAKLLSADQEAYVLPGERVLVADLIEDDMLLALPEQVCPRPEDCPNAPALAYPAAAPDAEPQGSRKGPFAQLAQLNRRPGDE